MFKNDYFEVFEIIDDSVLIANREGKPYKWGEQAVACYCPAHNKEISPFLMVKYSDNTWSLCHAEAGPMPEATRVPETEKGVCPIIFYEDFLENKDEHTIKDGGIKKVLMGLVSCGAILIGTKKISRVFNDKKISRVFNDTEKNPHTQDTCMLIKAGLKDLFGKSKQKTNSRG
jgi:hypothetical protein